MAGPLELSELDFDEIYELFTKSYLEAVGCAQPKEWFERHYCKWQFYGSRTGMVAVRFQNCGLIKLTGSAGNRCGVVRGLRDVMGMEQPVWTAVPKGLLPQLLKAGFIAPPAWVVREILEKVGPRITKHRLVEIHRDGSFSIRLSNIGVVRKSFVSDRRYYGWLLKEGPKRFADEWRTIPNSVNAAMRVLALRQTSGPGGEQSSASRPVCRAG